MKDITCEAVLAAVAEYDELGPDEFLARYGFGRAREYRLVVSGRDYDAKAIVGVAHRHAGPNHRPLRSADFYGGIGPQGAARVLMNLGFEILGVESASAGVAQFRETAPGGDDKRDTRRDQSVGPADVLLVGCVKQKLDRAAPARDLYTSPLFRKRRQFADQAGRPWFIVSAEHGLLRQDTVCAPYDLELKRTPRAYQREWGERVAVALAGEIGDLRGLVVEVHAGEEYAAALEAALRPRGAELSRPLRGLTLGQQLAWYGSVATPRSGEGPSVTAGLPSVEEAVTALGSWANAGPAEGFPWGRTDLNRPGLYSWWVDEQGAADVSAGLASTLPAGLLYAGQAGADSSRSALASGATLVSRIGSQHLRGRITQSTWRLSLASILAEAQGWDFARDGRAAETALTAWMRLHLAVAVVPTASGSGLHQLEGDVLARLDPPLNLDGMPSTAVRTVLRAMRGSVRASIRRQSI